jgi:hypothetical protein
VVVGEVDARGRVLADRFEIVARLGAGGMGEVYRARDRVRDSEVALKVLPALDATALVRFKNEFRALHDIQHPNLVRLDELHEDRGTWFFTMQLVDGVDLATWIGDERGAEGVDIGRLRAVLPQIGHALHKLHAAGLVHRDVKPSNILVTSAGQALVLDFGLVAPTWSPGEGVGTPAYMAPEQIDGHISPAADWYALGVIVYRALAGRYPFVGSPEQVIHAKQRAGAPAVRSVRPSAPADLAALADALLAREPEARPGGDAILAELGAARESTQVLRQLIVGRDRELAALEAALTERMQGDPFAVSIVGESGIGKTTLLRAFTEEAQLSSRAWVLSGRCWERESVPYKGFDGVIDELAGRLDLEPALGDPGDRAAVLVQAFPVLRRLAAFADRVPAIDARRETPQRVSAAIRWLLAEVAARRPLVIVIDDLQWADRDTIALLRGVLDPPVENVLVVFGTREPVELAARIPVRQIALQPLTPDDTTTLVRLVVRELGGRVDPVAVAREARGHPLFAAELARHAVATGELRSITFDEAIAETATRLGDAARRIATIVSVGHAPLVIEAVSRASEITGAPFFEAIAALRAAQLVATSGVGQATRLEPYHDRIRRTLGAGVAVEARAELHHRIAVALEASAGADPAVLAQHWHDAGHPALAARHALRAAEQAEAALAFHRAARLYAWVAELAPEVAHARVKYAECLGHGGRGVDAADAFLACAKSEQGVAAIDLRRRAMQQLLLMGHAERALALLDELMRELGLPYPEQPGRLVLGIVARRTRLRFQRLSIPARTDDELRPIDRARIDVLWDAAAGLTMVDPLRAVYFQAIHLGLCFRHGDTSRIARALVAEAPYLAGSGRMTRRLSRVLALTDEAAQRIEAPAVGDVARGIAAFLGGRWTEALTRLRRAEGVLMQERPRAVRESYGPTQLLGMTRRFPVACMYYLGQLRELRSQLPELLRDAVERNDLAASTYFRAGAQCVAYLAFGDVDTATRNVDEGARPWQTTRGLVAHYLELHARSAIDIYLGRGAVAYARVLEKWHDFEESRILRAHYARVSLHDIRGRTALAAARTASRTERARMLADAARCAKVLISEGAGWSIPLGESLLAGVALAHERDARPALERAAIAFDHADMTMHAAYARLLRAELAGEASEKYRSWLSGAGVTDIAGFAQVLLPH